MSDPRRVEFGDFLRSRREKLSPKTVGLPAGQRRRTMGLRREEVAQLAGIGVDWYIRLEQGRTVSPSVTTVDALARALRLSKAEHTHLKALARDGDRRPFVREIVPPPILRLIESLTQPAYITGRRWDVLAWNAAAEEVFAFGRLPEEDRNTLLLMMTNKQTRRAYGAGWAEVAKRMVAMFRATYDVWAGDPAFVDLTARLRQGSPEFVKWWGAHEVHSTLSGRKTMSHPTKGVLHFEHTSFQANDDPALKLVIYTPVKGEGSAAHVVGSSIKQRSERSD
ncbi:helix-turn-helix transcriptional regulator [Bradyrhizobium sp. LLZ17]|uniref:Helix-turn-helix transcriptional regulator n=1 Tax=Bradyrhizobium sp. LLZ17 TaxID=3239388 RepID=A0AB39XMA8_9BRAD